MRNMNLVRWKPVAETTRNAKYMAQQGGLFMLLWCLLLTGLLTAATPVGNAFHIPQVIAKAAKAVSLKTENPEALKVRKIQAILQKYETGLPSDEASEIAGRILREAQAYSFDPELILALVVTESSFYNWSTSRVGALGLMQLLPATGREMAEANNIPWRGKKTLFDPHLNIRLGTHYLATLRSQFGALEVALAAYNYGPARVARWQKYGKPLPVVYANRVLQTYRQFTNLDTVEKAEAWHPHELRAHLKSYRVASVRL